MDKLLGFSPDVDPTTPGVMLDVANLVPDESGMKGAPSPVNATGAPVLAAPCIGAAVITKLDDTRRIFAGTTGKLYELSAGCGWTCPARHTLAVRIPGGALRSSATQRLPLTLPTPFSALLGQGHSPASQVPQRPR